MITEETKIRICAALSNLKGTVFNLLSHAERNADFEEIPLLKNLALSLPDRIYSTYKEELDYLGQLPPDETTFFPYPVIRPRGDCVAGLENGLPFVEHNGKRLFFPANLKPDEARASYLDYIENEGLTGSGIRKKSPHCYIGESFKVEPGDIVLDIGSAEALFTLDTIDVASHAYIFECMKKWQKPLARTFEPYKSKVTIINKFVAAQTAGRSIRLADAIPGRHGTTFFMKMDIEGAELEVLAASEDFLKDNRVKLACCTYHRQDDAEKISAFLSRLGFKISFTDGYMLTKQNGIRFPYFRKGMIHATNF